MNERIRELADEAKQYCFEQSQKRLSPEDYMPYSDMYDKKFAELIIKECASVVDRDMDRAKPIWCSNKILKHFGVEE